MAIKLTESQRRAIDRAASVLETHGYDAFVALIERNKAAYEATR